MTCGVYEIVHIRTQRRYVGSSANMEGRWAVHRATLRAGKHHCAFLQNVWNKYPAEDFAFNILEECLAEALVEREQFHMDATAKGNLMNSQPAAWSSRGYRHRPESKRRLSEAAKRVAQDPEERRRRSERAKAQHAAGKLGRATWTESSDPGLEVWKKVGKAHAARLKELSKTVSSEEMSRRSYQRKMFQETEKEK